VKELSDPACAVTRNANDRHAGAGGPLIGAEWLAARARRPGRTERAAGAQSGGKKLRRWAYANTDQCEHESIFRGYA